MKLQEAIALYVSAVSAYESEIVHGSCPTPMRVEVAQMEVGRLFLEVLGYPPPRSLMELSEEIEKYERGLASRKRDVPDWLRREVFERDNHTCKHCGSMSQLSADHILAFSNGGLTTIENLQTLCTPCNSRKGAQ